MPETSYPYDVEAPDIPSGKVNAGELETEILADAAILIAPTRIDGAGGTYSNGVQTGGTIDVVMKDALDAPQKAALDAVVAAHVGVDASALEGSFRTDGIQRVQLEPSTKSSKVRVKGFKLDCAVPADAPSVPEESHVDIAFGILVDFQGIEGLWAKDHHEDDFMELLAMFPAGATEQEWTDAFLGPWPFSPLTTAPFDVELAKFGETVYLPPDGKILPVVAEGTFTIPPPLILRFCYFAHGVAADPAPRVTGLVRIWYEV